MRKAIILAALLAVFSCSKESPEPDHILGRWELSTRTPWTVYGSGVEATAARETEEHLARVLVFQEDGAGTWNSQAMTYTRTADSLFVRTSPSVLHSYRVEDLTASGLALSIGDGQSWGVTFQYRRPAE